MRLLLVNPNSNIKTTDMMQEIAQNAAPSHFHIDAMTAPRGALMITNSETLEASARILEELVEPIAHANYDGVIISAFGDPGLAYFKQHLQCPVVGIGEASLHQANQMGSFAIVTTTEGLRPSIFSMVQKTNTNLNFRGLYITEGDPVALMSSPETLKSQIERACHHAVSETHCQSLIIGGGPLALAARSLSGKFKARLIEPIPAAIQMISN